MPKVKTKSGQYSVRKQHRYELFTGKMRQWKWTYLCGTALIGNHCTNCDIIRRYSAWIYCCADNDIKLS